MKVYDQDQFNRQVIDSWNNETQKWYRISGENIERDSHGKVKEIHVHATDGGEAIAKALAVASPPHKSDGYALNEVNIDGNIYHVIVDDNNHDEAASYIYPYHANINLFNAIQGETVV